MDRSTQTAPGWSPPPALVAALFALALAPQLVDHILFHPDERHYVDGGLGMLESGDWLTPRTGNGDLRLQKPVLAYWGAALGAALFEPSPFSLRIVFLLTGSAVVWWGARVAREATGSTHAAALTALLLASQPALLMSATRSLPDVVLGLCLTISIGGFVAILVRGRVDWSSLLAAYVGGAMAVLSKGFPAAVFVAYATLFLCVTQRTLVRSEWPRLLAAVISCGTIGGSWFVVMQLRHGRQLAEQFLADQSASYRFVAQPWQIAWQALLAVLILAASFVVLLAPSLRPLYLRRRDVLEYCRQPVPRFLLGWIAVFLGCSACINHVSLRYLLPVAVPAAVLLGSLLSLLEGPLLRRNLRGLACVSLGLLPAAGLVLVVLRWSVAPLETLLLLTATAGVLWWLQGQLRFTSALRSTTVLTASLLTCILLLGWCAATTGSPSFGRRISDALTLELGSQIDTTTVTLIGEPAHASRLRVCSGGRLRVRHLFPHEAALRPAAGVLVTDGAVALSSDQPGTTLAAIPSGFDDLTLSDAWAAWQQESLRNYLRQHQRAYQIVRVGPAEPTTPLEVQWAGATSATATR